MHEETSKYVQASAQSQMMRKMQEYLTEEEHAVYRRGRNTRSVSAAKNQSITDYRRATGFEALLGYLYLKKEWKQMLAGLGLGKILFPLAAATGVGILLTRQIHLSPFFTLLVSAIAFFGVYGVLLLAVREQFTTEMMKSVFRSLPRNTK